MTEAERLAELRELLMNAPESDATRAVAIGVALLGVAIVLWLVRTGRLREEYTPVWMLVAGGILLASLRLDLLRALTRLIGAWTPSSTLFFLGELFLLAICLNYAVRLSRASLAQKKLTQEVALLRARIDRLEDT